MTTLREFLKGANFDFEKGRIYYQKTKDGDSPGWSTGVNAELISTSHDILDKEFYSGFGGPQCPRFVAYDSEKVYFPEQYDGSTNICFVYLNPDRYLSGEPTPYPGG